MQQPLRAVHYPPRQLHLRAMHQGPEDASVVLPATRAQLCRRLRPDSAHRENSS
jgi:hypothetical protein